MATRSRGRFGHNIYAVLVDTRLCRSAQYDFDFLLFGVAEAANGRTEITEQRKEAITSKGDEIGVDRHNGLHSVLASVLDITGGADQFAAGNMPVPFGGYHFCVGRLLGLFEFGNESHFVRLFE